MRQDVLLKEKEERKLVTFAEHLNGFPGVRIFNSPELANTRFEFDRLLTDSPSYARWRQELVRYVDSWLQAGRHFGQWQKRNPDLDRRLAQQIGNPSLCWSSDADGRAQFTWARLFPPGRGLEGMEANQAARDFLDLASNPLRQNFSNCKRCNCYFVNRSGHTNKRYCSRGCATRDSAERTTQKRRRKEREKRIAGARRALKQFARLRRRPEDWKVWVTRRSRLTSKWITRAINRGDLEEPRIKE